jgi:hypothetical protein
MEGMGVCRLEVHDRRNKVGEELKRYMWLCEEWSSNGGNIATLKVSEGRQNE